MKRFDSVVAFPWTTTRSVSLLKRSQLGVSYSQVLLSELVETRRTACY